MNRRVIKWRITGDDFVNLCKDFAASWARPDDDQYIINL